MAESQAPDDCTLPLGDIPAGWTFGQLRYRYWASAIDKDEAWVAELVLPGKATSVSATGPNPNSALLAAIAKIAA